MKDTSLKLEALFTIMEKHLYDIEDTAAEESQNEFILKIVNDYIGFLRSQKITIPKRWDTQIQLELADQVRTMLIKKMYGCLNAADFLRKDPNLKQTKQAANKKYNKLF